MRVSNNSPEQNALVLQGGGALGAYQAGAYEALAGSHHQPDWIAGISIGAINAAIIAGNPVESRLDRLNVFWEQASSALSFDPWLDTPGFRNAFTELAAASVMAWGVPGFFNPRFPTPAFMPYGSAEAQSYYDTLPLKATLEALVDFDFLNSTGPRLSVGAVDVETGNFTYFDSKTMRIGPEHIMASGALPPGFPPSRLRGANTGTVVWCPTRPFNMSWRIAARDPCAFSRSTCSARAEPDRATWSKYHSATRTSAIPAGHG